MASVAPSYIYPAWKIFRIEAHPEEQVLLGYRDGTFFTIKRKVTEDASVVARVLPAIRMNSLKSREIN